MNKMTLEQVRDWHFANAQCDCGDEVPANNSTHKDMANAIDAAMQESGDRRTPERPE